MLMPLLVTLRDFEVEVADSVVPQVSDRIEDERVVLEQVSFSRLLIDEEGARPAEHLTRFEGVLQVADMAASSAWPATAPIIRSDWRSVGRTCGATCSSSTHQRSRRSRPRC